MSRFVRTLPKRLFSSRRRCRVGLVFASGVVLLALAAGARLPATLIEGPAGEPLQEAGSVVEVTYAGDRAALLVDGEPTQVRCIGYNPVTEGLTEEERAARYDRDFALMQGAGVNVIGGWIQDEYDHLLLDKAEEYGLGVILPFQFDPHRGEAYYLDYTEPEVRNRILRRLARWVERYRNSPALMMWGIENEVLLGIERPESPSAKAFARFLIEAVDTVHQNDPEHPVIYREAEDVFLAPIVEALRSNGASRPWLVLGMNFYTYRMADALTSGLIPTLRQPLLISEFGLEIERGKPRAEAYLAQWNTLRAHPRSVLGGCAYVWTTAGHEAVDEVFGLTNVLGNPVDETWPLLADVFSHEARTEHRLRTGGYGTDPQRADPMRAVSGQQQARVLPR